MTGSRWTVLVLVLAALGLSVAYGLRGSHTSTNTAPLKPLQDEAALAACPPGLGPAFPKITLPCLGGGADVSLQRSGTGRPTLVNVYGSWCGPCQKEMPVLRAFYDKAKERVALVGVDTTEEYPRLGLLFAIHMKQHWPSVYDDGRVVGAHFQPGVPLMVFVDAVGTVVHVESGGYESGAALAKDVHTYLGITV